MRFVMFGLIALIGLVGCQQNREKKIWPQDDLVVRANDDASKIAHRHWTVVSKKEAELGKFRERGIIVVLKYDYDKPGLAKLTPGTTLHLEIFHSHRFLAEFDGLKEGDSIWLLHLSFWHQSAQTPTKCTKNRPSPADTNQQGGRWNDFIDRHTSEQFISIDFSEVYDGNFHKEQQCKSSFSKMMDLFRILVFRSS